MAITLVTAVPPSENTNPWYATRNALDLQLKATANAAAAGVDALEPIVVGKSDKSYVDAQLVTKAAASDLDNVFTIATAAVPSSQKGANNGVATLDAAGKLPTAQLPALAVTEFLGSSANQAAMLAKVGQQGDWTTRTDTGTVWIITGADPTQVASWTQITYPTAPVTTVAGRSGAVVLTKTDVGLPLVDNTSDANKPVSTAQAAALALKAPLESPAFTGTPTGITKAHVGLPSVDNTTDANKPVSTAQAAAIAAAALHSVKSPNDSVLSIQYVPSVGDIPAGSPEGSVWLVLSEA